MNQKEQYSRQLANEGNAVKGVLIRSRQSWLYRIVHAVIKGRSIHHKAVSWKRLYDEKLF